MYFRPGIRWIPTYRIDLRQKDGKNMAQVSLQAEILNEAEDLHDVPLDIVVGVPNFRFKGCKTLWTRLTSSFSISMVEPRCW